MADAPTLRKIQLDTLDDLRYLYSNLVRLVREKIDIHVPPPRLLLHPPPPNATTTPATPPPPPPTTTTNSRGSSSRGRGGGARKSTRGGGKGAGRARASTGRAATGVGDGGGGGGGGGGAGADGRRDGNGGDDNGNDNDNGSGVGGGGGGCAADGVVVVAEQADKGERKGGEEEKKEEKEEEEEDPLRKRVDELVMQYITSIFDLAAPSISINGLDALSTSTTSTTTGQTLPKQPPQPEASVKPNPELKSIIDILKPNDMDEYEPYDRALHARLQSLYADIETYTVKLAQQRREAPVRALRRYDKALNTEMDRDLKLLDAIAKEGEEERKRRGLHPDVSLSAGEVVARGAEEGRKGEGGGQGGSALGSGQIEDKMEGVEIQTEAEVKVGAGAVDEARAQVQALQNRHSEVVSDWERSMGVMGVLAKGLPATAHKLERAKAALEYIEAKERKRRRVVE